MLVSLTRLAAVALVVCAPAFAAPAGAPIPAYLAPMLAQMNLQAVASLGYQDQKGTPIDADKFAEEFNKVQSFAMIKKPHKDGPPDVILRLQSPKPAENSFAKLKAGEVMPQFQLKRLDGQAVDNKTLQGRYTLVSFYFAECGPCVHAVPQLNALAARRKDVNMLAMTFDSEKESKEFVSKYGLAWPVAADAGKLTNQIGVKAYPTLALFDPNGRLVDVLTGGTSLQDPSKFDAWLDKKLAASN